MVNRHTTFSAVIIAIAAGAFYYISDLDMDSSIFPQVISVVLIGLNILHIIKHASNPPKETLFGSINIRALAPMVFGIIGYVTAIKYVGFVVASLLFLSIFMWLYHEGGSRKRILVLLQCIIVSCLVTFTFYGIFQHLFLIPLPEGVWFAD